MSLYLCDFVKKEGTMKGKLNALSRSKSHVVRIYSKSIINLLSGALNNTSRIESEEKELIQKLRGGKKEAKNSTCRKKNGK